MDEVTSKIDGMSWWSKLRKKMSSPVHKTGVDAEIAHAHVRLQNQEYDGVRPVLVRLLERKSESVNPDATEDYLLRCLLLTWISTERYEEGILFYSTHLEQNQASARAYSSRAALRWYQGDMDHARNDYQEALRLAPNDIESLSGYGQMLAEVGENREALMHLDNALTLLGQVTADLEWTQWFRAIEAYVRSGRGSALGTLGQKEEALAEFRRSIAMEPKNAWAYYNRAKFFESIKENERALEDYETSLKMDLPALNPLRRKQAETKLKELS
jgi:tetratricopeptide (TPR) repeat protein